MPEYFRGPVPWDWIRGAAARSALETGLVLWHLHALRGSTEITVGVDDIARRIGISASTVRRSLKALETAGLIRVARAPGQKSAIILVDPAPQP